MKEPPKGFKGMEDKLAAFMTITYDNCPSDRELRLREMEEQSHDLISYSGATLASMAQALPDKRPTDDVHYLSAVAHLYRRLLKENPDMKEDAIKDLHGSELLKRVNKVLGDNGHKPLTKKEIELLLTGPRVPAISKHAKPPLIIKRLEEYGKEDSDIQAGAETMLSLMLNSKSRFRGGTDPLTVDSFIRDVQRIHMLAGARIEAALEHYPPGRWKYSKDFTTDLLMHELKAPRVGHRRK